MKATSILALLFGGMLATLTVRADTTDLDGRELVVLIFRRRSPEHRAKIERKTVLIKNGMFRLDVEDVNGSTPFEIVGWEQTDKLVRQLIGKDSHCYKFKEGPDFYLPIAKHELQAREVLVRVYENWQDPTAYENKVVAVRNRKVRFDFNDVNEPALVAVLGEDQPDETVKKVLGKRVYGWAYKKGLVFYLPVKVAINKGQSFIWTFFDALGSVVRNATVEVYLEDEGHLGLLAREQLNEQGQLKLPFCAGKSEATLRLDTMTYGFGTTAFRFVVSHPDYGSGVAQVHFGAEDTPAHTLFIPAVPPGNEAEQRSVWGTVVDPENNPLSEMLIWATCVYPLGGSRVRHVGHQSCGVLTDEHGRFKLYLPVAEDEWTIGTLIPPKSEYYLLIKPPKELGFLPFNGRVPNGQETKITLKRAGHFHTFAFEDENGLVTEPNQLKQIELSIDSPGNRRLRYEYDHFKDGGYFPLGTYQAMMSSSIHYNFEPIEVTADSPEELIFKLPPPKLHYGQVVNGVTGTPMKGAFVIDMDSSCSHANLSMITDQQWEKLHTLGAHYLRFGKPCPEILRPVDQCYSFSRIVRTDANGWFEMKVPPKRAFHRFVVFEKGFLPVLVDREDYRLDDDGNFKGLPVKLFPAAKVVIEPYIEGWNKLKHLLIVPEWIISENSGHKWSEDLPRTCRKRGDGICETCYLHPNKRQSFYVPAGVELLIQLRPRHGKGWSPVIVAEGVTLQQGQTLDLGRPQIQPTIVLFAEVLDSAGQPVEGVPVQAVDRYGTKTSNTDEDGIALFDVAWPSKGEFVLQCYEDKDEPDKFQLRETTPYEIAGPQDANTVYTLQISDEMLRAIFR